MQEKIAGNVREAIEKRRKVLAADRSALDQELQNIMASTHDESTRDRQQYIKEKLRYIDEENAALDRESRESHAMVHRLSLFMKSFYTAGTVAGGLLMAYSALYHFAFRNFSPIACA